MKTEVIHIAAHDGPNKADMLAMLDRLREDVESGVITRIGVVAGRRDGAWQSEFSRTGDCRIDAAMLIELAIRRLGFVSEAGS